MAIPAVDLLRGGNDRNCQLDIQFREIWSLDENFGYNRDGWI